MVSRISATIKITIVASSRVAVLASIMSVSVRVVSYDRVELAL